MKYRVLSPQEIETYNIGYQVGNRQIVITDIEWESDSERKIYRKGYLAGCKDFQRKINNVNTQESQNDVNNVNNVNTKDYRDSCDSVIVIDTVIDTENKSRKDIKKLSTARTKEFIPPTLDEVLAYAKEQTDFAGMGGFPCAPYMAEQFWSHYQSQGWRKSNDAATPVQDWHAALRMWARGAGPGRNAAPPPADNDDDLPV